MEQVCNARSISLCSHKLSRKTWEMCRNDQQTPLLHLVVLVKCEGQFHVPINCLDGNFVLSTHCPSYLAFRCHFTMDLDDRQLCAASRKKEKVQVHLSVQKAISNCFGMVQWLRQTQAYCRTRMHAVPSRDFYVSMVHEQ